MSRRGFTLIELLVVSIILLTLSGVMIANYNRHNDAQKVRQAALTLKNDLRFAQSRAMNGEKPEGCATLDGYLVTFSSTSYTTEAACSNAVDVDKKIVTLPGGLTLAPAPSTILFGVLSRGISTDVTITITGASNDSYQFTLTRSGDMSQVERTP